MEPEPTAADPAADPAKLAAASASSADVVSNPQLDDPQEFAKRLNAPGTGAGGGGGGGGEDAGPRPTTDAPSATPPSIGISSVSDAQREAHRDQTRETISLWLIGLLCAIVVLTFAALFARGAATGFGDRNFFHELKQVLDVLVAPIITLLASAIGFYFGVKQGESSRDASAAAAAASRRDATR